MSNVGRKQLKKKSWNWPLEGRVQNKAKVVTAAVNRNDWKLRERLREYQDFEDEELLQIALDKDEVSRR